MKKIILLSLIISILYGCKQKSDITVIDVSTKGIMANTGKNITAQINRLIEDLDDQPVTLVFPKGRYDFYPDSAYLKPYYETNTYDVNPKRLAVFIDHKKNITIDAQGSDFIYHDHIQPFTIDHSENIIVKNVNIDWDKPLTAECEVLEANEDHLLVKIDTFQFPHTVHKKGITFAAEGWKEEWKLSGGSWLIEFDKDHRIPSNTGDHGCVNGDLKNVIYSEVSPGLVLMKGKFTKTPAVGNHLIMRHSTRDHAGMFIFHSKDIRLENINVYHTSGLGILSQYSENLEMRNVNMIPNPKKNRYLSGHDDGLHFMGCKGEIIVDHCDAQGLMDDPINIHGTYVPVSKRIDDHVLKCSYAHSMSMGLIWAKPGDSVGFVHKKDMRTTGYGIIEEFRNDGDKGFFLKFKEKLPGTLSADFSLENLSCIPNVTITNCFVGSNRARGYLISTPGKVVIENNIFETSGSAILIAGDANYWYESGAVKDITIRNNEFRYPCNSSAYQFCNAIISIYPEIPEANPDRPYHQNITIENNTFDPYDYPILYARSVNGLRFNNNTITRSMKEKPWRKVKYNFVLDACKNVDISGNKIEKNVLGKNILLKDMSVEELHLGNKDLEVKTE